MPKSHKELSDFQIRNIKILSFLLRNGVATDEIIEYLREIELDYYGLEQKYKLLEEQANIDEKTSLLKYKKDYMTNILKTTSRIYQGLENKVYTISFVRFDIDDFSLFNNKYGHDVGDKVLVQVARTLTQHSRPTDYVIRFGGEEFDVILPGTSVEGTLHYLKTLYEGIHAIQVPYEGKDLKITISGGVSSMDYIFRDEKYLDSSEVEKDYLLLQKQADDALYMAKYEGKDCYKVYKPSLGTRYHKIREEYSKK